jgi:hypothetical protein
MPERFQLSRHKGWRMPPNGVTVARPGRFGNPFRTGTTAEIVTDAGVERVDVPDRATAVTLFERLARGEIGGVDYPFDEVSELRGRDLGCWCSLDGPCHADTLLRLANG